MSPTRSLYCGRRNPRNFLIRLRLVLSGSCLKCVSSEGAVSESRADSFRAASPRAITVLVDERDARNSKAAQSGPFAHAKENWVSFAKNRGAGSHRFCFGGFEGAHRVRPPFSSMNSTPAHAIYLERLVRFASRRPTPPPFSGMNLTPPLSSAGGLPSANVTGFTVGSASQYRSPRD